MLSRASLRAKIRVQVIVSLNIALFYLFLTPVFECTIGCYIFHVESIAQPEINYPVVGRNCPDYAFTEVKGLKNRQQISIKDFRGKWLILDFWSKSCGACIASFPKMSHLQVKYEADSQVLMVGKLDRENKLRGLYSIYEKEEKLRFACAFDTGLIKKWKLNNGFPYIVVIDPTGIVRRISTHLSEYEFQSLRDGTQVPNYIDSTPSAVGVPFNVLQPLLINGNGGKDTEFLYRSILAKWNSSTGYQYNDVGSFVKEGMLQENGLPLLALYLTAYFGKLYWQPNSDSLYGKYFPLPESHVHDSSIFAVHVDENKTRYSYSLIVPKEKSNASFLMKIMQQDLTNYFGYNVRFEIRKIKYWRLVVGDKSKLKTADKDSGNKINTIANVSSVGGYDALNYQFTELVKKLYSITYPYPILDETGISGNVDLNLNWIWPYRESVNEALIRNGLRLVESLKEMKVLVISE